MKIRFRSYKEINDLDLQYKFWIDATKDLPYAWKPTKSPTQYQTLNEFNPKSKCFAFDEDKLVGYMSFSGEGNFVSPGYPWCQKGYEVVRDELWDRVFGFASSGHGGTNFYQRFRESWETQIEYFLDKGFKITSRHPMYVYDLEDQDIETPNHDFTIRKDPFDSESYFKLLLKNTNYTEDQIKGTRQFYSVIDFDNSIQLYQNNEPIASIAISQREDNGFCEILALTHPLEDLLSLNVLLAELIKSISDGVNLNLTTAANNFRIPILEDLGFENEDHEIYVGLDLVKEETSI